MKKFTALAASVCLLAALAGCSGQQTTSAADFSENDLMLVVDGKEYRCRDNIQNVLNDLGDGYQYAEGKSCNYDGLDKTYTYDQATFYTNPLEDGDMLSEIYSDSEQTSTSKGISVGSSRQEVLDAYGQPNEDDGYLMLYRDSDETGAPTLCFELENEQVSAIFLTVDPV